jgi:hypothetical protein
MAMSRAMQRRLAHGGNATLVTVMVVVLVGLLFGVADRNRVRWDFSAEGANELLPDTINKLALLDEAGLEVDVYAFSAQQGNKDAYFKNRALKDLLDELEYNSKVVVSHFVDFDRERLTAESLGVREYGHLVIKQGDKRVDIKDRQLFRRVGKGADKRMEFMGEAAFSRAAAQLLSDKRRIIYSLRGHGELDPEDSGPGGLSQLSDLLDQENYELEPLDLFRDVTSDEAPIIPLDAAGLLIARPAAPLTPPEEDAIVAYLASGKPLMVWVDRGRPVPAILDRLKVSIGDGMVMDKTLVFPYPDRPVPQYRRHAVTSELSEQRLVTVLSSVAPVVTADPAPEWARYSRLLETSRQGWVDHGGELVRGAAVYEPGVDEEGPVTMAIAVELQPSADGPVSPGKRVARVMVVGDAEFATNTLLAEGPGNETFLVNAFRWMLWDDNRLSVIGKPTRVRRLALTDQDKAMLRWLTLGLLPLITALVGAGVWASRRGR